MSEVHPILSKDGFEDAVEYVSSYFHDVGKSGRKYYAGAYFDTWAGGGNSATANELTGDDFVAVSMLSVEVPGKAAAGLAEKAFEVRGLLAALPVGLDFTELSREQFDRYLGKGSPGWRLWHVLRSAKSERWGIGETTASKILARKRPALIPIYDSEVGPQMGLQDSDKQWERWHQVFQDDVELAGRLDRIGKAASVPHISRLRIMDVALWRYAKDEHPVPSPV
ncbi:hypothetical protein GC088_09965 [Arthrobacter sp. JZ12]|uniref:DUF6308 family protein n=1 Tax=Arthrobacter sp. JZ12 TaxID=2654190 RepID=UPI002B46071C|nr:DUF6308 family protein [Arthrobacter sp. JZ12]WRH25354.1 hypothetical protein GC088_09965 [Arthrobacter sp. JZ12]